MEPKPQNKDVGNVNGRSLLSLIDMQDLNRVKFKALETMTHQVYSQHIGKILGGRVTVIVDFDAEPRLTRKEWEEFYD